MEVATWNTAWRMRPAGVKERIDALANDVLVLTEVQVAQLPASGTSSLGGRDWGYPIRGNRRKVALWSRMPPVDPPVEIGLPGRGLLAGFEIDGHHLWVAAVCVPWSHDHVSTGAKDRAPWERHLELLDRLDEVLQELDPAAALIVAGDMNRAPESGRAPRQVHERWDRLASDRGLLLATDPRIIDQVWVRGVRPSSPRSLAPDGLSDHHAVSVHLALSKNR